MPQPTPLRAGDPRRVGRYQLAGRIEGIPADDPIYLGTGPDGAEVAISMLRSDWARDAAARDRFAAEATVAKRVPPFCAARVLDAGLEGSDAYLVSEYIPGPSLLEVVTADGVRRGAELDALAIGMATGLASVHQAGLVHGNFGPEYVIMAGDGTPRVVEFGITPPYGTATPAADMLAWSQTVMFAAIGRPAANFADLDVLPASLSEVIVLCLDRDPGERPAARAAVLWLLGDREPPAGVLAEGSRRATRPAAGYGQETRSRHSAAGHNDLRPAPARPDSRPGVAPARSGSSQEASPRAASPQAASARPAGRRHHGAQRGGARRGLLAAAAVLVVVLAALAVAHVLLGGGPNGQAASAGTSPGKRPARAPASPSASPSPGPTIPAAFAGTWSGQVRQPPVDTYSVTVTLATGSGQGTVSYSGTDFSCSGALSLTSATSATLSMHQVISKGSCESGAVTITRTGARTIAFRFHRSGPVASGTLTRR